jgi:cation-transporting ATPase E
MSTYPFVFSQMIILEMFVIGIPAFCLSMQPNDSRVEGRFINYVMKKSIPGALVMVLSVVAVEILKLANGTIPTEIYTTMQVFLIYFSGTINLYHTCKPLNTFRSLLFFGMLTIVSVIVIISVISGFSFLQLCALTPLAKYWPLLLFVLGVITLDIPLAIILRKVFDKINFPALKKNK